MSKKYKYPRTLHCPWSLGAQSDDKVLSSMSHFTGKRVVVTEKMDGENTSLYHDYYHARSIDGRHHWSRSWVKQLHARIAGDIPFGWRLCGENMYAKHSIKYNNLSSYFYLFSIWDESNHCLSWDKTVVWAEAIGLEMVPVLYDGVYDEDLIKRLYDGSKRETFEGYVIRNAGSFHYSDFKNNAAKFVRANHVQPQDHHWFFTATEKNELK